LIDFARHVCYSDEYSQKSVRLSFSRRDRFHFATMENASAAPTAEAIGQLPVPTIDADAVFAAAAAAAAVPCSPTDALPSAAHGQMRISSCPPAFSRLVSLTLDSCVCVLTLCGAESLASACAGLRDADGQRLCERGCGRRLSRVAVHRPLGAGRACHPECKQKTHQLNDGEARGASDARPAKKQRRTKSDPGQPQEQTLPITSTRLRIRAPKPPPSATKPRIVKPTVDLVDPMALLDAAHARRMALLQAEKNGTGSSATNGSAVVW
jgi:hypothetical protein